MQLRTEILGNEFLESFRRFEELVGAQAWRKRAVKVRAFVLPSRLSVEGCGYDPGQLHTLGLQTLALLVQVVVAVVDLSDVTSDVVKHLLDMQAVPLPASGPGGGGPDDGAHLATAEVPFGLPHVVLTLHRVPEPLGRPQGLG